MARRRRKRERSELGEGRRKSTGAVITTLRRDVSAALGWDACVHARHCKITASKTITLQANSSRDQPWTMRPRPSPPKCFAFSPSRRLLLRLFPRSPPSERASLANSMPIFPALLQFLRSEGKIRGEVRRKQKKRKGKSDNWRGTTRPLDFSRVGKVHEVDRRGMTWNSRSKWSE